MKENKINRTRILFLVLSMIFFISSVCSCSVINENEKTPKQIDNIDGEIASPSKDSGGSFFDMFGASKAVSDSAIAEDYESESAPSERYDEMPTSPPSGDGEYSEGKQAQAGTLTAGEWRDNHDFSAFLKLMNENDWFTYLEIWKLYPTRRVAVKFTDNGTPASGIKATLLDASGNALWNAVSDASGKAYFFYGLDNKEAKAAPASISFIQGDKSTGTYTIKGDEGNDFIEINCKYSKPETKKLDLLFMVDTTGSMGDELSYLQTELRDVILRVSSLYQGMEIRLSVNFYRDIGDEYTVRYFKFNSDIDEAITKLAEQRSSGGGDYPEAVDAALENAVINHAWDEEATKLMFLVLDAPPHVDRQGSVELIEKCITKAASDGIRIIPVASSGVDAQTESLMRTMAVTTGGTYVFLTNDSGVGGDHLEASVGDFEVEKLNELMIRLITEYCA